MFPVTPVARSPEADLIDQLLKAGAVLDEQAVPTEGRCVVLPKGAIERLGEEGLHQTAFCGFDTYEP